MSSRVNVCSVNFLNNPASFTDPFKVEIIFEAFEHLPHDLEWELIYVGSSESSEKDQSLDSVVVGPINEGRHKFVFETDPPNPDLIPAENIVDVTVILLRCSYNGQQFSDIGWFVSNEYTDEELIENPPAKPIIEKIHRTVKIDDVRVTMFTIKWDDKQSEEADAATADEIDETDLDAGKMMETSDPIASQPLNDKTNC